MIGLAAALLPAASARPAILVTSTRPVVIAGARFEPAERVVVRIVTAGTARTKTVTANGEGAFRARFLLSAASKCKVFASATGSRGSKALWKPTAQACAIDLDPVGD